MFLSTHPLDTSLQAQKFTLILPAQRCMALLDFWDDPDSDGHKNLVSTLPPITLSNKTTTLPSFIHPLAWLFHP